MDVLKVTEDGDAQKVMMAYAREKGIWLIGERNGWNKVIDVLKVTGDGDAQKVMMAYAREKGIWLIGEWNGWNKVIDVLKVTGDGDAQKVMMAYAREKVIWLIGWFLVLWHDVKMIKRGSQTYFLFHCISKVVVLFK